MVLNIKYIQYIHICVHIIYSLKPIVFKGEKKHSDSILDFSCSCPLLLSKY